MDNTFEDLENTQPKQIFQFKTAPIRGLVLSLLVLGILLFTKDPGSGGPRLVIFFLSTLFVICVCVFMLLLQLLRHLFKFDTHFSLFRLLYSSVLLSLGAIFLVGLQTLGQLGMVDVILVTLFELVINFYIIRRF